MKFNSQICTTREQSERLLALGLKKETADMVHEYLNRWDGYHTHEHDWSDISCDEQHIPAWSLHRLWELDNINYIQLDNKEEIAKLYDCIIDNIEVQIKEGNFNKEYLV